jgi:hypothetical protein
MKDTPSTEPKAKRWPADGGPAFARAGFANGAMPLDYGAHGMSLRDYFAVQILQGIIAAGRAYNFRTNVEFADAAYGLADTMLNARKQGATREAAAS